MSGPPITSLLVTGAAGFVGRHLLDLLADRDDRPARVAAVDLVDPGLSGVAFHEVDLTCAEAVAAAVAETEPDGVVHLAGRFRASDPAEVYAANVLGWANLASALARLPVPPRVLVVGTAAQYGITEGGREVVREDRPLLGRTPYGLSKTLQERWALFANQAGALRAVCVRPFNLMGPGQSPALVPAAFLGQVRAVARGDASEVRVGNLAAERDFLDVRDLARALWALMDAGPEVEGRVFNVASGEPVSIEAMLRACLAFAEREVPVVADPARFRPVDVPCIVGDASALRDATGWAPEIPWRESLADMWHALGSGDGARPGPGGG